MTYLLYNPLANNSKGEQDARQWAADNGADCEFTSLLGIADMKAFFDGLGEGDEVILTGGDGTINRFANDVYGYEFKNAVYYVKCGSGNDFYRDMGGWRTEINNLQKLIITRTDNLQNSIIDIWKEKKIK